MGNAKKTQQLVTIAVLAAIIVILQLFASGIKVGPFSITLALIPIVLGAFLYGPRAGAILGFVFGCVVTYAVITGIDVGGNLMLQENAIATVLVCLIKSTAAGAVSGIIYKAFEKRSHKSLGLILGALACPVINTSILAVAMITIFRELVSGWAIGAGSESLIIYIITGMLGLNFVIEIIINIVLSPVLYRIIKYVKK